MHLKRVFQTQACVNASHVAGRHCKPRSRAAAARTGDAEQATRYCYQWMCAWMLNAGFLAAAPAGRAVAGVHESAYDGPAANGDAEPAAKKAKV